MTCKTITDKAYSVQLSTITTTAQTLSVPASGWSDYFNVIDVINKTDQDVSITYETGDGGSSELIIPAGSQIQRKLYDTAITSTTIEYKAVTTAVASGKLTLILGV